MNHSPTHRPRNKDLTSPQTENISSTAAVWLNTKTCLSICKHGGIVAFEAALDQLLGAGGVDGVLLGVHVKQIVKGEGLVFSKDHLGLSWHHVCTDMTSLYLLPGQLRTDPTERTETTMRLSYFSIRGC